MASTGIRLRIKALLENANGAPVSPNELLAIEPGVEVTPAQKLCLRVHICELRKEYKANGRQIKAERGVGYFLLSAA